MSQRGKPDRLALSTEVIELIRDMWRSNPTWGSPRIVGEFHKIGIDVAKTTVETYRPRICKPPSPTWKACLSHHGKDMVACDFFPVPTATFRVLCVCIILAHERRRIVHCNMTKHPTAQWTAQQIVDAFPWDEAPRSLIRDRDGVYGEYLQRRVKNRGIAAVTIAPRSPWQHPYCERVIGSIRRDALDQVIVLNERHLRRVLQFYVAYYHDWRTHLSLEMDAPASRVVQLPELGPVRKRTEVGGLQYHCERIAA